MDGMAELLADEQIQTALDDVPEWTVDGNALVRTVKCRDFPAAIEAVQAIGAIAEDMDHHPDIDIRWRTLHFSVSTHSLGGITGNDFTLAAQIDAVLADFT